MSCFGCALATGAESPPTSAELAPDQTCSEPNFKILVVGEIGTGKTCLIKRYAYGLFSHNYKSTLGVDFALKTLYWEQGITVRLQLWDIAGQERFGNMTRVYYKEASAAFVVFDVTRPTTFDMVKKWKADLDEKLSSDFAPPIPVILLANKIDLQKSHDSEGWTQKLEEYCQENGFAKWFETSALTGVGIEDAGRALVEEIFKQSSSRAY